jgi:hypothetical protein
MSEKALQSSKANFKQSLDLQKNSGARLESTTKRVVCPRLGLNYGGMPART